MTPSTGHDASPYDLARQAADVLRDKTGIDSHDVALVMGSGWLPAAEALGESTAEVLTTDLPGFAPPAVEGHSGAIRSIDAGGRRALVFLGRTHYYEGRGVAAVVHGVRMAAAAGCRAIVLTNGCGGLRPEWKPGTAVLIRDHINLTATSPIVGAHFVDLTDVYSPRLRGLCQAVEPSLDEGVYVQFPGPHYETPAEIEMVRRIGGDLAGMSTTLEAIAAREAGLEILGISLVTNAAAGMSGEPLDHEEVLQAGQAAATRMGALLAGILPGSDMRVLVTGASGRIGTEVCAGLAPHHEIRGVDLRATEGTFPGELVIGDCANPGVAADVVAGVDAVVHLAGTPGEGDLHSELASHAETTAIVLDAMINHRVKRMVYASSNHAVGMVARTDVLGVGVATRPDTFYGVGKVAAEALLSLYADRHGISSVAMRIGSFREQPQTMRELSTWLSPGDCVRLVDASLSAEFDGVRVVYGISANTDGWWDLEPGRAIGYYPIDDAAALGLAIAARADDDAEGARVGGAFALPSFARRPFSQDELEEAER